jgi:hypothetical protein
LGFLYRKKLAKLQAVFALLAEIEHPGFAVAHGREQRSLGRNQSRNRYFTTKCFMYCARLQRMKMEGFPSTRAHPAPIFSKEIAKSTKFEV